MSIETDGSMHPRRALEKKAIPKIFVDDLDVKD